MSLRNFCFFFSEILISDIGDIYFFGYSCGHSGARKYFTLLWLFACALLCLVQVKSRNVDGADNSITVENAGPICSKEITLTLSRTLDNPSVGK